MPFDENAEALQSCRGLYKPALFEADASKLPLRIERSRRALAFRYRELFAASPNYSHYEYRDLAMQRDEKLADACIANTCNVAQDSPSTRVNRLCLR